MKFIKKIILLSFVIVNFSCSKDKVSSGDGLPYFQFLQVDNDKLLSTEQVGKMLIFKNQNNDELVFEIVKNEKEKKLYSKGNWVYASYSEKYFYYDQKNIELQCTLNTPNLIICISKWQTSFSDGSNGTNVSVSNTSKMVANINVSNFNSSDPARYFEYYYPTISLVINGNIFNKVVKMVIPNTQINNPGWLLPKINFLYYDHYKGVIGFDDINNNEWRLQN